MRRSIALLLPPLILIIGLLVPVGSADAQSPPDDVGPPLVAGQAALNRLGGDLALVASEHGMTMSELRQLFASDRTLHVDRNLRLAYVDEPEPGLASVAASPTEVVESAPPTDGPQFQLASLPGAAKTVYLDFDGHVTTGTSWNANYSVESITSPAYDRDGSPDTWSAEELQIIENSWKVVAEDFAPFSVNVTTIDPGEAALRRSGSGDDQWGIRVVISANTGELCGSCGGIAYINSFGDSVDEPTFVYNTSFKGVSEAISHEVGHTMGLAHDGVGSTNYYTGHGEGATSWAPIMGVAYYVDVGQWSRQEYVDANNTGSGANYGKGPDDLAIISSLGGVNDFGYRADDHGNSATDATALNPSSLVATGLIERTNDVDAFSFTTEGGAATFDAVPAALGPNLDISLSLLDDTGQEVASSTDPAALSASLVTTLSAGSYTVVVDGVGVGDPSVSPPTGYSDYASLGAYWLTASFDAAPPPPPPPPPGGSSVANGEVAVAGTVSGSYLATNSEDGASQVVGETDSGGRKSRRHDTAEHRWSFDAPGGVQTLTMKAIVTDGGDADAGFAVEWSDDATTWAPLGAVTGAVDQSWMIGSPQGTVWVRVIDTDSTSGERSYDTIAVDLLRLDGEEGGDPTTALVSSLTVSSVSTGRGQSAGMATVSISNELGQPVSNASVAMQFSGSFTDQKIVITDDNGQATFTTSTSARKPTVGVCVTNVSAAGLNYTGGEVCA